MSFETTMARAAARDSERVWTAHRKYCFTCRPVWRTQRKELLCADGTRMLADRNETRDEAARQADLDKLPIPGQGQLWTDDGQAAS
jgi:hypothetical protein